MVVSKTSDHIKIKVKIPNPSQEPPASSKARDEDLKDMDVLYPFKIKIERQNLEHGCLKDQCTYPSQDQYVNPKSVPSVSSKAPNKDIKDMDVLCTSKIKIGSQNSEYVFIKNQ